MIDSSPLLEMQLRGMHLTTVLANYQRLLGEHAAPLPYLSDLISLEAAKRQENGVKARIAAAHFPTLKTIESFDFALQPELPKAKLLEHFEGSFVDAHRNIILSGPPGVGKSHILSAIGLAMCMRGYRVLFTTAAALLMKLIALICCSSTNSDTFRSNEKRQICSFNSFRSVTNDAASRSRLIFHSKSGRKSFLTRWPRRP
jgi:DNA replication protein DnaC